VALGKLEASVEHQTSLETAQRALQELTDHARSELDSINTETDDQQLIGDQITSLKVSNLSHPLAFTVRCKGLVLVV